MKKFLLILTGAGLLAMTSLSWAGDTYLGVTLGAARTIWAPDWNSDGYSDAGNGAPVFSLRVQFPYKKHLTITPFISYATTNHTTSYREGGYDVYIIHTERTYYREMEVGAYLHYHLPVLNRRIYIGGGPELRFHESGRRLKEASHQMETHSGTSPGIALVCGWTTTIGEKFIAFFEPQFVFSPDAIDRQEAGYPPDKFSLQMGILWK